MKTTEVPEQIGRYRITGEVGRGGMGIVYRGEDRLIGRDVAIKTLTEVTEELRERFYMEARSGILSHPNIVTVYELGEHEGSPFIAMEYIAGESLEAMLRTRRRLSLLEAISIIEQLCAGLGYAHGHGVLHRDVKPANVLVQPDGRVTIVDFGIARLVDQTHQLTKTDALLGTFHYIAPERLKGEASDGRADVWSVGIILYEILTGELPFKGKDISSLYRVIYEPYVPLQDHVPDIPEGISRVLDRALAKEVEDRYATTEEMAFDLQVVADTLKHDRVATLLESARRLAAERQFASARTILLQAQRIDPGNTDAKLLIVEVQEQLSQLQRGEQLRQIVEQAQNALGDRRWDDAITFFQQAQKLDTDNVLQLEGRLQDVQEQKKLQQTVIALWEQASTARSLGDLEHAQECLGQALQIDGRNTDLRNAHAVLLREIKRKRESEQVEALLRSARESYSNQEYAAALGQLRQAAEIDPSNAEVQQLLLAAGTQQRRERREQLLEKIATEIRESLDREDFEQAENRIARALEALPGDSLILQLKIETETRKRESAGQKVVRETMLQVHDLLAENPARALEIIEQGLALAPDSETLQQSKAHLQAHLRELKSTAAHEDVFAKAHAALAEQRFAEARSLLESAIAEHGTNENFDRLLNAARAGQQNEGQEHEQQRQAAEKRAALEQAVASFDKCLADDDLNRCMRSLEELAKRSGEEEEVKQALAVCSSRRKHRASAILRSAAQAAQSALTRGAPQEGTTALRRAEFARPFADGADASEFDLAKKQCLDASRSNRMAPRKASPGKRAMKVVGIAAFAILLVVLAVVAIVHSRSKSAPEAAATPRVAFPDTNTPPIVQTDMEINASPWANVLGVQNDKGDEIALPSANEVTPLRIENVQSGHYKVTLAGADGKQTIVDCDISTENHLCMADLTSVDMQQLLKGAQQ
jgi:predicted Ser/Thr protein kinase